jgi:DNA-binding NarL/FixJ family response regulator
MSATPTPRILLVARPGDAEEISGALVGAGFSAPEVAAGGDETLTLCQESVPAVVVLCASLEQGDARSLASAMRAALRGRKLGIVLVGDAGGPIRNALDAADFEVDRFVGRPLSPKALVFAVRSCAREVADAGGQAAAQAEGARAEGSSPRPMPRPMPRMPIVRAATTPGTGPPILPGPVTASGGRMPNTTTPGLERAMEEAISRFVSDAMHALDTGLSVARDRDSERHVQPDHDRDGRVEDLVADPSARSVSADATARSVSQDASTRSSAAEVAARPTAGESSGRSAGESSGRSAGESSGRTAGFSESSAPTAAPSARSADTAAPAGAAEDAGESAWQEPPTPALREPTLILPGGGRTPGRDTSRPGSQAEPVEPIESDLTAPEQASFRDGDDAATPGPDPADRTRRQQERRRERRSSTVPPREGRPGNGRVTGRLSAEPGDLHDESPLDAADMDDDFDLDPPGRERGHAVPDAAAGEGGRSPMARELRRKMSMMAERLFPGRGERSRLDVGLAHDAHTEIDLTAIGVETVEGVAGGAPYEAIGSVDTFADTNPLSRLEPTPSEPMVADDGEDTGRRRPITSEPPSRGDLTDVDVASLLGRLLQSRFTGRVLFRRGPAEKTIHFEDGRPVFAISNLPHDRMGDLLYREGKITREQQQRARDLVVESGRRMGEILVEVGFLKPRELLPAVRHHIEDIVYSLFAWDSGEFAISAGDPTSERIRLTRHPAALVLEGVRRKYGPDLLEARLRSASAVVAVRSQRQLGSIAAVADLSPSERAVIQKMDGERTVQQVAEAAQVDHLAALQLAFALIALGVAEVVDHGPEAEPKPVRSRSLVGETDIAIDRQRVLAKHALVHEADYFTLLGVRRDATGFEIRRAYEAARRDYAAVGFPPELQRELAGELGEISRLIDEAYQVLRDERVRRSYQANLLD